MPLTPGARLGPYDILAPIGAGGMGVVYRARDTKLGRLVALKVVSDGAAADDKVRARMLREARTASALNHPNICTVYEAAESGGQTFIAMELVEGRTLADLIGSSGLPVETLIRYATQLTDALAHAHDRGIVHRDLKGSNVIVTSDGRPKILDFGLAKQLFKDEDETVTVEPLTEEGTVAGTLAYMPPEVLNGQHADTRGDLWSLGVILYKGLTGRLPFQGKTQFDLTSAILRDPVPPLPPTVPSGLAMIVQRLLAKSPGERYQRASEVRAALETMQHFSAQQPVTQARSSRRFWLWSAAALPMVGAVAWIGFQRFNQPSARAGPRLSDGARPSNNHEANDFYERGLQYAGSAPRTDLDQWRRMLDRALALDARFAAARGQIAFVSMLPAYYATANDTSAMYKAEEEARRALKDDPDCAVAHSALAGIYLNLGRKDLVPGEIDKALQANPSDPAIQLWRPMYHLTNGDYTLAIPQIRLVMERSPLFFPAHFFYAQALREQGDTDGSMRELNRILEQAPGTPRAIWEIARIHMDSGDLRRARQTLESADTQSRLLPWGRLIWGLILALEGKRAEALRELDEATLASAGASFQSQLLAAEVYAVLGDIAKALEWVERAARSGDEREGWLRRDPFLANVRDNASFQQILEAVAYRRKQRSSSHP